MNRFYLKQGQGLKASAAHPHPNFPCPLPRGQEGGNLEERGLGRQGKQGKKGWEAGSIRWKKLHNIKKYLFAWVGGGEYSGISVTGGAKTFSGFEINDLGLF